MKNLLLLTLLSSTFLYSESNFHWEESKSNILNSEKSVFGSIFDSEEKSKTEKTKEYIKYKYGVSVDRKTAKQLREEQKNKSVEMGIFYMKRFTWQTILTTQIPSEDGLSIVTTNTLMDNQTTPFGIYIDGKIDLSSIGWNYKNIYGNIELSEGGFELILEKRWFPFTTEYGTDNLFFGIGAGFLYQMNEGVRPQDDITSLMKGEIGYNFETISVKGVYKVYNEINIAGEKTSYTLNIGYRF
jgi:hypothetical protein